MKVILARTRAFMPAFVQGNALQYFIKKIKIKKAEKQENRKITKREE